MAITQSARGGAGLIIPDTFVVVDNVTITSEATIWTPGAGKKFRLLGFHLATSTAIRVTLKDGTGGTVIYEIQVGAGGHLEVPWPSMGNGLLSATAANLLTATGSGAGALSGTLYGTLE